MKHPQLKKYMKTDLMLKILLSIIGLKLVLSLTNPIFMSRLSYVISFTLIAVIKLGFYLSIGVVCFFIGHKLGDYLKAHFN